MFSSVIVDKVFLKHSSLTLTRTSYLAIVYVQHTLSDGFCMGLAAEDSI